MLAAPYPRSHFSFMAHREEWETGPDENPYISTIQRQFSSEFGIDDGFWSDTLQMDVTLKDVIYLVSESWDNVTQNCLVKSWKKLWPSLADSSKVEQGEANKSEILPLIKYITGCKDATEHTVTEWLSCETEANQLYTDEEIISLVQNKPQDGSDLEETDEPENVLVSHSEAASALEIALHS
ncbi:hypothetical protein AVEN_197204-1 [Araneus ventricosus]|uniref:DDE-1 domain-containing protein n=1 Tax=Araneus ventricosus TaxID=182803 RepID=A0A4Y2R7T4_ARAVE|nr:hypothetical protein AVEN_197204-1 [Araneus ventricosus]